MPSIFLSSDEKASLTDFAKNVVATGSRSSAAEPKASSGEKEADCFSNEGLSRRLIAFERQLDELASQTKRDLDAVLFSIKRCEDRAAKSDGEIRALRELMDRIEFMSAADREELFSGAKEFAARTAADLSELISRLSSILEGGSGFSEKRTARSD